MLINGQLSCNTPCLASTVVSAKVNLLEPRKTIAQFPHEYRYCLKRTVRRCSFSALSLFPIVPSGSRKSIVSDQIIGTDPMAIAKRLILGCIGQLGVVSVARHDMACHRMLACSLKYRDLSIWKLRELNVSTSKGHQVPLQPVVKDLFHFVWLKRSQWNSWGS